MRILSFESDVYYSDARNSFSVRIGCKGKACEDMMQIHWRGNIRCEKIDWILDDKEITLDDALEARRDDIWKSVVSDYPDTYDGNLLSLQHYNTDSDSMTLYMNTIKFSRILTLERLKVHLKPYGAIGMQLIVLSPDKDRILIGQRSKDAMYCPLFYSVPGGMLEIEDTKSSFRDACLREFNEETQLSLSKDIHLVGIASEINGTVGVVFLLCGTARDPVDVGMPVQGNEEWENRILRWYSVRELSQFTFSNSLEGVVYARKNIESW